jgi:uncharacterized phage protein (TIGR01671 family)
MRTIKFRAWDKTKKVMTRPIASLIFGLGGNLREISEHDGYLGEIFSPIAHIEIMQFTGLLDRNGKEIYEGDVVKCGNMAYDGVIIFNENISGWGYEFINKPEGKVICHFSKKNTEHSIIIGNIYEHPELIKQ